jgi:hypothetical protein
MTDPIAVKVAREQLGELISTLGELRNAGPRDQRFKQWRQNTTTLLQRIWPDDPTCAERFRRMTFSAPAASADRHATRDYFERGCRAAASYLDELALKLGGVAEPLPEATLTHDHEPVPSAGEEDLRDVPPAPRLAHDDPPPPQTVGPVSVPEQPEARKPATGLRLRLKDMLGFTDEAAPDVTPARPVPVSPPSPAPVSFVRPSPEASAWDARRDLAAEFVLESAVLQAGARSTREPEPLPEPPATTPAAQDLMALADRVDELGVPSRERPIVRAALIDLARQMESPPVNWEALRDTIAYAMDHPALARRILPLVLPYLDRAA